MTVKYVFNPTTGNIDATDKVAFNGEVTLGSAASPSIFFTGDTNTGIYSPGADQLALSTNGTGRLFINANGNVGVHLASSATADVLRLHQPTASTPAWIKVTNAAQGSGSSDGLILGLSQSGDAWVWNSEAGNILLGTNASERLRITSAGLVGIGTSAPSQLLDLSSTGNAITRINSGAANTAGVIIARGGTEVARVSSSATDTLTFSTGSAVTPRLTIDSSGRVGIGTASPNASIIQTNQSTATIAAGINLYNSSGVSGGIVALAAAGSGGGSDALYLQGSSNIQIVTGATERARIDSSGRLLVGTSSARANFFNTTFSPKIQFEGVASENASLAITCNNTSDADASVIALAKSSTPSVGSNGAVVADEALGFVHFLGNDGAEFVSAARISAFVDGTPGADDMPGRLVFSTTADGASSPTERMRIKANGTINFSNVAVYADNTAALAGGLVAGDVYRKSDGTLMITY